jgi:hypothetical protein
MHLPQGGPRIVFSDGKLRIVLRDTRSWPNGYVDIERAGKDAMGEVRWHHLHGVSLEQKDQDNLEHVVTALVKQIILSWPT